MLLPGTINIGGNGRNIQQEMDVDQLRNMTNLRAVAVPIYMNGNYKRCNCPEEKDMHVKEENYLMHQPINDIIFLLLATMEKIPHIQYVH